MIYRILLTGGPHSGKTSAMLLLQDYLEKMRVPTVVVPESATRIISSLGSYAVTLCQHHQHLFQVNVVLTQKSNELVLEQLAQAMHRSTLMTRPALAPVVMIFDRGVLDGAAFVDNNIQWDAIMKASDTKIGYTTIGGEVKPTLRMQGLPCFDLVVHMQSCACGSMDTYSHVSPSTHTTRLHGRDDAVIADKFLYDMYCSHDNFVFIPCQTDFQRKIDMLLEHIQHLLHPFTSDLTCSVCQSTTPLLDAGSSAGM